MIWQMTTFLKLREPAMDVGFNSPTFSPEHDRFAK